MKLLLDRKIPTKSGLSNTADAMRMIMTPELFTIQTTSVKFGPISGTTAKRDYIITPARLLDIKLVMA